MISRRALLLNLLLLSITLLVGMLFLEIALRILGIGFPTFTRVDAVTGFSLRPGASGWQHDEGQAFIRINHDGMRDDDRPRAKPAGTFRIAVLGDSYTEARQVMQEQTFATMLERELGTCGTFQGKTIDVLNFGVSGFGTTQELLMLQDRVWQFEPDLILLAFTTGNDIRNNSFALEGSDQKPYARLQSGSLVFDNSFRETSFFRSQTSLPSRTLQWALLHSRLLQLLNRVRAGLSHPAERTPPSPQPPSVPGGESGIDSEIYKDPVTPEWQEAWAMTEALLKAMHKDATEHHVPFIVATLSNAIQVHPDPAVRKAFQDSLHIPDLFYPDHRISVLGKTDGFPVLALAPILQKRAEETKTPMHGFEKTGLNSGHWNVAGHAQAGKEMGSFVCERIRNE